jgi:hypothetical protein
MEDIRARVAQAYAQELLEVSQSLPPIPLLPPIKLSARICGRGLRCRIRVLASSWIFFSGLVIVTTWLQVLWVLANFRGCQFVLGITVIMLGVEFPVVCRRISIPILPKSTVPELLAVCFRRSSSTPSSKDVLRHGGVALSWLGLALASGDL